KSVRNGCESFKFAQTHIQKMSAPKFNIYKGYIRMTFTIPSGRVFFYTGIKVDAKDFVANYDEKKTKPIKSKAPNSEYYNNKLDLISKEATNILLQSQLKGLPLSVKDMTSRLNAKFKKDEKATEREIFKPKHSFVS